MNPIPKVTSRFSIEDLKGKSIEMNLFDPDLTITGVRELECSTHPDGDGLRITIRGSHTFTMEEGRPKIEWPEANLEQRFVDLITTHLRPEIADYQLSKPRY